MARYLLLALVSLWLSGCAAEPEPKHTGPDGLFGTPGDNPRQMAAAGATGAVYSVEVE